MYELRIDARRFRRDFDALAEIGSTGDGGVHRPALSENHLAARRWFTARARSDGFEPKLDAAANHSVRLCCANPDAPTILLGSHLDSVPRGGRYDGALGVVAAYETLRCIRDARLDLPVHIEAIDFTDEEGTFVGLLGSRALAGSLTPAELDEPRCGHEELHRAAARAGLDPKEIRTARRDPSTLAAFLELHIEQGPHLVESAAQIGVVTAIVGIGSYAVALSGRSDHAGTTPLGSRRDAGLTAAELVRAATRLVRDEFSDCMINFGQAKFYPGAYNIVPGRAELALEFRAADRGRMEKLDQSLQRLCREIAAKHGIEIEFLPHCRIPPVNCAAEVQAAFVAAGSTLGLRHLRMTSGAGHDAGALAAVCPAGLVFIPSTGGSHSARESAEWGDCVAGANALLLAALEMARRHVE